MHQLVFLQDLAMVMVMSAVILIFCRRFGLPVVLGYILAGAVIGPHTPPFPLIRDLHSIHTLSELGIIFLLFSIGLEFSLTKLIKVGLVAFFAATFEIILMLGIGYSLGRAFGWGFMDSVFLGAILSISSTTIIAKVLIETKRIQEKFAQVILGILIVEDLLAIVIIALLSGIASTGSLEYHAVALATVKVTAFIMAVIFLGFLTIPRILRYLERFEDSELMVITVLGMCFAVSLLAAKMGFSVALGSFLVGAIIAETRYVKEIIHKMESIRDMFTAIFFVSVGMMIDPGVLRDLWMPIAIITLVTILGKVISCSLAAFLTGHGAETSLKVGLGLAQIGEFSFIIAKLGEDAQVTSPFLYPLAVSVSGVTTLTTPLLMRNSGAIVGGFRKFIPKPMAAVFSYYTERFEVSDNASEASANRRRNSFLAGIKNHGFKLFFYGALTVSILYGLSYAESHYSFFKAGYAWFLAGALVFLPFLGFAYSLDRLLWETFFLSLIGGAGPGDKDNSARILHNAFRFFMALFTGFIFLAAGSSFLPRMPLAIGLGGLIIICGLFLWSSVRNLHEHVERMVLSIFSTEKDAIPEVAPAVQDELVQLIQKQYPWNVETADFLLPYHESSVNRKIKELRLRNETGASIIAIYRGDLTLPNPSPEERLFPGDVLLLMGDKNQVIAAIQFLQRCTARS